MGSLGISFSKPTEDSEEDDEFIPGWIADILSYFPSEHNISSKEIVRRIKPEDLYSKYHPMHETSVKNGVEKLMKIYFDRDNP